MTIGTAIQQLIRAMANSKDGSIGEESAPYMRYLMDTREYSGLLGTMVGKDMDDPVGLAHSSYAVGFRMGWILNNIVTKADKQETVQ